MSPLTSGRADDEVFATAEGDEPWERRPVDRRSEIPVGSAEVVVPLAGRPEVVPGLWDSGGQEGMVFVANPTGPDVEIQQGDVVAGVVPAGVQTRTCTACGHVDTDGFISDLTMCETCGTLLPKGRSPCRQCLKDDDDGEHILIQMYAGCSDCKAHIHSLCENSEPNGPTESDSEEVALSTLERVLRFQDEIQSEFRPTGGLVGDVITQVVDPESTRIVEFQDPRVLPCFHIQHNVGHIVEEPGGIRHMTDCEVPPEGYYDELTKDLLRRYPKACKHVIAHLVCFEAFADVSLVSGFSYGITKAQIF